MMDMAMDPMAQALPTEPQSPLAGFDPLALPVDPNADIVERKAPEISAQREALVKELLEDVQEARTHWQPRFKQMRQDQKFASGKQWNRADQYTANIVLRHIQQRTASLYGKNPTVVARRKNRMVAQLWDGSSQALQMAQQSLMMNPMDVQSMMILADAQAVQQDSALYNKMADTLKAVWDHNVDEQAHSFKTMLKMTVRRALTTGVGYVKIGFQRAMKLRPDVEARISDYSERLSTIERLSADISDGEVQADSAEAERLRLAIQSLETEEMILVREGLTFGYPGSTSIIPDMKCKNLKGFLGCDWVAEEYFLTANEIQEIYGKDVQAGGGAHEYRLSRTGKYKPDSGDGKKKGKAVFQVFEVYSRKEGLVYVICDGFKDFLQEPDKPEVWLERFYPWFPITFNDVDDEESVFPPSDVSLVRDMQMEINRARQGLREHRKSNRPKIAVAAGMLDEEDKAKLQSHPVNAVLELNALAPGQSIDQLLQPVKMPPIDPALYDTEGVFQDILRVVGTQEANLGGTGGATATETNIAESSRMSAEGSSVDDLDEMLSELARAGGQILLSNVQKETVVEIVGPGAVWPEWDREMIAREIYLEIEAASTGRPNKAAEVQNAQAIFPLVFQIPGISPEWAAKELIRRMDDKMDLKDAFMPGMPSMQAMAKMGQMGPGAGDPASDPNAQGGQGGENAQRGDRQTQTGGRAPSEPTGPLA